MKSGQYQDLDGAALVEAAAQAGIRLTLLDTCYLTASVDGRPLTGPQQRFGDGDALPSVRNVAAEYRLNPLTVLKGYQELVDEGLVEKKRGRGMFVNDGARTELLKAERQRFLEKEWPQVQATIERLGLDAAELLQQEPDKAGGADE